MFAFEFSAHLISLMFALLTLIFMVPPIVENVAERL